MRFLSALIVGCVVLFAPWDVSADKKPTIQVDADATVFIKEKANPETEEWGNAGDSFLSYDFVQQRFYFYDKGEIYGLGTEMLGWENENPLAVVGGTGNFVGARGQYTLNMVSIGVMMAEFKFYLNNGNNIDFENLPDPIFPLMA